MSRGLLRTTLRTPVPENQVGWVFLCPDIQCVLDLPRGGGGRAPGLTRKKRRVGGSRTVDGPETVGSPSAGDKTTTTHPGRLSPNTPRG